MESSLRPLIELETWIIGTLGYNETKFTKPYNTVGYVKNYSTFMALLQFNNFQRNIKFKAEVKREKYCYFQRFYLLIQYRNYSEYLFRNPIKKFAFEIQSKKKFTWTGNNLLLKNAIAAL